MPRSLGACHFEREDEHKTIVFGTYQIHEESYNPAMHVYIYPHAEERRKQDNDIDFSHPRADVMQSMPNREIGLNIH